MKFHHQRPQSEPAGPARARHLWRGELHRPLRPPARLCLRPSEYCRVLPVQPRGAIIDAIHAAQGNYDAIIMNPGAFTHYSLPSWTRSRRSGSLHRGPTSPTSISGKSFGTGP